MKKVLLSAAGVVALSACSVAFVFGLTTPPVVKTEYKVAGQQNSFVGCQSAVFAVDASDPNFGRAPRNATQVRVSFQTNADLKSATVRLVGSNGNDNGFSKTFTEDQLVESDGMNYVVKFEAVSGGDQPLPTGIITVPKVEKVKLVQVNANDLVGSFEAEVTATTSGNPSLTTKRSSVEINVYKKCTVVATTNEDV